MFNFWKKEKDSVQETQSEPRPTGKFDINSLKTVDKSLLGFSTEGGAELLATLFKDYPKLRESAMETTPQKVARDHADVFALENEIQVHIAALFKELEKFPKKDKNFDPESIVAMIAVKTMMALFIRAEMEYLTNLDVYKKGDLDLQAAMLSHTIQRCLNIMTSTIGNVALSIAEVAIAKN